MTLRRRAGHKGGAKGQALLTLFTTIKRICVDGSTMEANAALRTIVHWRDLGKC
jgi:hypothetical protein